MAKLEITLHEKGGDNTYKQNHVSGQKYLDLWTMQEAIEKNIDTYSRVQILEKQIEYIASLFADDKLTAKQILQGTDPWELVPTINRLVNAVLGTEEKDTKKEQ
ncbi:phage tail assembly chaperone G [Lactococcus nasutitermitis]|uniref:Phage tail assembly chaperone G n=1 Tax=Lactococcus nasutitermitis TaxID=1652957 RepID=A0ABV9JD51_9LACT|nr:hypothetical protein [Lactococcus nasutitermitis]